jgi:hypothetical protein
MSDFMIGATVETLTALNQLTTPVDDPQPEYRQYRRKDRVGDMTMKGRGPRTIIWQFAAPLVAQVAQMNEFQSDDAIYIQSRDKEDAPKIYEVLMVVPDPREDGDHEPRMHGHRNGFIVEFIVLSEVEGS